jgi:tetratricopeptide (TPR) repeat protein
MVRRQRVRSIAAGVASAVAILAVAAMVWAWPRLFPDPLEPGRSAYERRDWPASARRALEVLRVKPGDGEALRLLARASGRMGQDETASGIYKRLGPEAMGAEDFLVIAGGFHRQGDLTSAFRLLEKGHSVDPDHADTLHDLSRFCASMDRLIRAEELAARLAARPGQGARAEVLIAAIRDRLSDPRGAAEALERALQLDPDLKGLDPATPEARKLLARDYLKLGQPARARERLLQALGAGPDREASWLLCRSWLQDGRLAEAASALQQASGYCTDDPTMPEPAPYVGSAACAACHEATYRAAQSSRHARTFMTGPGLDRLAIPDAAVPDPADPKSIHHRARRKGDTIDWETQAGGEFARAVVRFAFGSGDRGVTPVGRDDRGRLRELRLSRYGKIDGWDLTTGHMAKPDTATADVLLGRVLNDDNLRQCLSCHTTDFRAARDHLGPLSVEGGIGCEKCHGPAGNHLKAVDAGFSDPAIGRPRLATAEQVTRLCAECHSPPGRTVKPTDPDAVRFQGTTLPWSRCYQNSKGRMSCVTCHDPHRDASRSAAHYEAKCLDCHSASPAPAARDGALAEEFRRVPCPIKPSGDCLKCHMPPTSSAVPHTTFTDHHIRVHSPVTAR